ncbi:MAG: radical SAM protein [Nanoarchaeota archaeon]|nr:radical SAM protein [Nanoarchaeota archaeon]
MVDIILFQPKCGIWDIMGIRVPIGLLSIAADPVKKGYETALIDQRTSINWKEELKKQINSGAKLVCLTTMVGEQIKYMLEVSKFIKSINPRIITVLGGSWAQTEPEMCMQDKNLDIVCYGEGDYILSELMEYINKKRKIENILGIIYRDKEGNLRKNKERALIKDLDDLPKIPYNLIDLKDYTAVGFRAGKQSISLVLSRGCPYRCTFCSIVKFYNRSWRGYSLKRVMEDINELDIKYNIKDFYFNDDNIAGNPKRFSEFVKMLVDKNRDYNWGIAGIRADTILSLDEETLQNLVKSGCKNLDIGAESGSQRILDMVHKDESLEKIREANKRLSKYPLIVKYTFMGGFPTETEKEFLETLRFKRILEKENPHAIGLVFFYTPFPRTEMFSTAVGHGLNPPKNLIEWADFNYDTWTKKQASWLTKRKIKLIENSVFISYFANNNLSYKYPNPLMNFMFKTYYPLAKFRYDNNFYSLMIEKKAADVITKLNEKYDLFNRIKKKSKKFSEIKKIFHKIFWNIQNLLEILK